jgi:hypothetical protein
LNTLADPSRDLQVYRKWNDDPELLGHVRDLFAFPAGEDRVGCYIYSENEQHWNAGFADTGQGLLKALGQLLGITFTIVVLQAYRNGSGCDWHADDAFDVQAILSLGVTRKFGVRWSDGDPTWLSVEHGDLLVMPTGFQVQRQHCVPVEPLTGERCSLVFRTVARS